MTPTRAALEDAHGLRLPIGARAVIGRDPDACDVIVGDASVSRVHAYVARAHGAWWIEDADSRNGTYLDGARVTGPAPIRDGARVRVGAVTLVFREAAPRPRRDTQPLAPGALHVATPRGSIEVAPRGDGGVARGPGGAIELTARELGLVQLLAARRAEARDPDWAYVASRELAGALGFRSIDPGGDNVRELVCRVRKKLASIGGAGVVQSKPNVGYRIATEAHAASRLLEAESRLDISTAVL
jgi:DNA-binding response OmpR family regulator